MRLFVIFQFRERSDYIEFAPKNINYDERNYIFVIDVSRCKNNSNSVMFLIYIAEMETFSDSF